MPEWVALAVICERPTHGFAIATLTTRTGPVGRVWQIPRPVVYRALGRLLDAGLITPECVEPGLGPQRTRYRATDAGHRAVEGWLAVPVEHVRDVRSHLLVKLALLERTGRDRSALLAGQRARLEPIAEALAREEPGPGLDEALLAWRRACAGAALAFLDDLSAR